MTRVPAIGRVPLASSRGASSGALITPATAPGLQTWLAPDSLVSGAAWNDKSGNANNWSQATGNRQGALQSILGVNGLLTGVQSGTARFMAGPVGSQDCNSSSLYVLVAPIALGTSGTRDMLAANAGAAWEYFEFPVGSGNLTPLLDYPTQGAPIQSQAAIYSGTPTLLEYVANGAGRYLFVNGANLLNGAVGCEGAMAVGLPVHANNLFTTLTLGIDFTHSADTYATSNVFLEVVSCSAPHSPVVRRNIEAYFANKYGFQLVFDGNSQVAGTHDSGQGTSITGQTASLAAVAGAFALWTNLGTNGITTPQLSARFVATVAPHFNAACNKIVHCMWEIENDISANGASGNPNDTSYAATAWANLVAYSRLVRQYAPSQTKTCVLTCLPNGNGSATANYEALRQAVNALVRANYAATDPQTGKPYFDAVADVGATTGIGALSDTTGPHYNSDFQHLNDAGVAIAAHVVEASIASFA